MRTFKAVAAFALLTLTLLACAASPDGSDGATGSSQAAVTADKGAGGIGAMCNSDSSCARSLYCEPICPVIPNLAHCNIAGGTCEPACTRTGTTLSGLKFESADTVHSITFTSATAYSKTDGCPNTGIHCNHVLLTTGTYTSNGTTIDLVPSIGVRDTLTVEAHCYEGLVDNGDGVELWPAAL